MPASPGALLTLVVDGASPTVRSHWLDGEAREGRHGPLTVGGEQQRARKRVRARDRELLKMVESGASDVEGRVKVQATWIFLSFFFLAKFFSRALLERPLLPGSPRPASPGVPTPGFLLRSELTLCCSRDGESGYATRFGASSPPLFFLELSPPLARPLSRGFEPRSLSPTCLPASPSLSFSLARPLSSESSKGRVGEAGCRPLQLDSGGVVGPKRLGGGSRLETETLAAPKNCPAVFFSFFS